MKIAVTTENDQIFQHFGQCQVFTVFSVEEGRIKSKDVIDASKSGHSALAGFLNNSGIDVLICGGIGGGAKQMIAAEGIKLISGISGNIETMVKAYLAGQLTDMDASCTHHEHEHAHECSCGSHCH